MMILHGDENDNELDDEHDEVNKMKYMMTINMMMYMMLSMMMYIMTIYMMHLDHGAIGC